VFYEDAQHLSDSDFCRLTGLKRPTFEAALTVLKQADSPRGRPPKLSMENRLLMALAYWREYRTYFHIATDFGLSESACFRTIAQIENTLVASPLFTLPGRKALTESVESDHILIDATESPIERPKRKQRPYYSGKKNGTP
jgi:hypothetical protein